ncbi:outer membrane protein assembly factor BamB family protein [Haloarcula laminariae]|uniref:outer membrane protein assembly factor BamB family protein n=1 Tax=Haloarcula laminariae TaxID=2961577 RepID=UPI00240583AA|nr:PQQ-binding-like beta-propeller repeat protein [Halomicroarcula sp. FL173]
MESSHSSRREWLSSLGVIGVGFLAGCSSDDSEPSDSNDSVSDGGTTPRTTPDNQQSTETKQSKGYTEQLIFQLESGESDLGNPIVANNSIYFGNRIVRAVDNSGNKKWEFDTGDRVSSIPGVRNGTVYVGSWNRQFYALDASDGSEKWTFSAQGTIGQRGPTPVTDESVYFAAGYRVYALDAVDGKEQWFFEMDSGTHAAPAVTDDTVIAGDSQRLYALNRADGNEVWRANMGQHGLNNAPPVANNGTVLVPTGHNDTYNGKLFAFDIGTGEQQWTFQTEGLYLGVLATHDGTVYLAESNDNLYALDAETGEVQWKYNIGDRVHSPVVANDTVYVGGSQTVYAVSASDGEEKWTFETSSTPSIATGNNKIYASTNSKIYEINTE